MKSFADLKNEIADIANFSRLKIDGLFDVNADTKPVKEEFKYNVVKWIDEGKKESLKNYKFELDQNIFFEFSEEQIRMRDDYFKRYGTSINSISKIVTRISGLEGQYRKIRLDKSNELRSIYRKVGEAFATKYAMSG